MATVLHFPPLARLRSLVGQDVFLPDGRTLRVGLLFSPAGDREELILAIGTGTGNSWREDPAEGLVLPADVLGELRQALEALERAARGR